MKKILSITSIMFVTIGLFGLSGCAKSSELNIVYSTLEDAKAYNLVELGIQVEDLSTELNVYDSSDVNLTAVIEGPSGEIYNLPMFYYEEYKRDLNGNVEELSKIGEGQFRFRFTPIKSGKYQYYISEVIQGVTRRYPKNGSISFDVKPGSKDAFLKVSDDKMHLEYSNGEPFVGIGNNYCGWEWAGVDNMAGTYDYDRWFYNLYNNGANMTQFDICEGDQIEWTKIQNELPWSNNYGGIGIYNQEAAFKTDHKVNLADTLGLFYRFSIFHWEDFDIETDNFPDWGWQNNPYNIRNGGPVTNVSEFFVDAQAKKAVKNLLRYVIARWSYSTSLMMYELWNEVDAGNMAWGKGESYSSSMSDIVSWHDEMAKYIKSIDVHKHLITTSFANSNNGQLIWALDSIDVTTYHRYTIYNGGGNEKFGETVKTLNNITIDRFNQVRKPTVGGEFALSPGGDVQRENDKAGIVFHNALYASIFSNNLGTAMSWNWGSYVDEYNLYFHYKGISNLLRFEDLSNMKCFNNLNIEAKEGQIWYMGLKKDNCAYLWIKDSKYDYLYTKDGYIEKEMKAGEIPVIGLNKGQYIVSVFDTYSGDLKDTYEASNNEDGTLIIKYPSFEKDIAIKIILKEDTYNNVNIYSGNDDTGYVPRSSYTIQNGNHLVIYAGGYDIGGSSDSGRFAYLRVNGNFEYIARIDKTNYAANGAKAGIMLREDISSSSKMMFIGCFNNGFIQSIYRKSSGGLSGFDNYGKAQLPSYLKIQRIDNTIISYISLDGIDYTKVSEVTYKSLENTLLIGVIAANKNTLGYNKAIFSGIQLIRGNE